MVEMFVPSRSQPFVDSDCDTDSESDGICVDLRYLRFFRAMESVSIREIRVPFAMACDVFALFAPSRFNPTVAGPMEPEIQNS